MKKFLRRMIKLGAASALLAAAVYAGTDAFGRRWRAFVIEQLAERGLYMDFRRLVLDPFGGMMARDVRLFSREDRQEVLVSVDRLRMDVEFGRLVERRFEVQGFELTEARLSIPVEPESENGAMIEVEGLNARAFLRERRLELRHAEGMVSGIKLRLFADLLLPAKKMEPEQEEKTSFSLQERMKVLENHQQRIVKALEWLDRFHFTTAPELTLEARGEMDKPLEMSVRMALEADRFSYGTYALRELVAEGEYQAGLLDLKRLFLKDETGTLNANGTWRMGAPEMKFHLTSSANLPALALAFLDNDNLREVVFYESPNLALDGIWHVRGELAGHKRPVQLTGSLDCGRFSTRGAVFDGISAKFGVAPEGVYIRDLLLRHQTGTLSAQALVHEREGFRYRAVLRMDPNAFLPFAQMEQTREIIRRFEFHPSSNIYFELEGAGDEADLQQCLNRGRGELRNFRYRGAEMELMSADVEFKDPMQHYRNVRLKRAEGVAEAEHVEVHDDDKWVRLTGVKSGVDPVVVTGCFAPKTAEHIAKYRLPVDTKVELDGVIYHKDGKLSDFRVNFSHPSGHGQYRVLGEDYLIHQPQGKLHIQGGDLAFDIQGKVLGGTMNAKGTVSVEKERDAFAVVVKAAKFPYTVFDKAMPFEKLTADVKGAGDNIQFDIRSALLGGSFSLKGKLDESRVPNPHQGELRLDSVSLQKFARIYSPESSTQGDITGHFRFTGKQDDWQALSGEGAAIILNGNLYSVPILGPLTPLLDTMLPGKIRDYNVATEANCTFQVENGLIKTKNFEALTSLFKLASSGSINFIKDEVDLTAQVRVRGLPGIVFRPFSELLEYRGKGTVKDTQWSPAILNAGQREGTQPSKTPANRKLSLPLFNKQENKRP